jgi:enamine deaminase RidA (YjgF/YER057c/UK114 family)
MQIVEGGVEAQTRQALKNLKAVVEAAGASTASVLKTTVFLKVSVPCSPQRHHSGARPQR